MLKILNKVIKISMRNASLTSTNVNVGAQKKKIGKGGPIVEKKVLPVETDTKKLVKYVCGSNIYKEGMDIELRSDVDYPDWLWKLNTGKPKKLEELDPNTKEYWYKVRKLHRIQSNKLTKIKR